MSKLSASPVGCGPPILTQGWPPYFGMREGPQLGQGSLTPSGLGLPGTPGLGSLDVSCAGSAPQPAISNEIEIMSSHDLTNPPRASTASAHEDGRRARRFGRRLRRFHLE